jgi:hypothetical protein
VIGAKWDATASHSLVTPPGAAIERNQYILDENGIYYRVVARLDPSRAGSNVNHEKYILEEIQVNNDRIIDNG